MILSVVRNQPPPLAICGYICINWLYTYTHTHVLPAQNLFGKNSIFDMYLFFFSSVLKWLFDTTGPYSYIICNIASSIPARRKTHTWACSYTYSTIIITIIDNDDDIDRRNDDCYWNVRKKKKSSDWQCHYIIYAPAPRLFRTVGWRIRVPYSDCEESKNPHTHTHVYETYNDNLNPFSIVCVCKHVWVPLRDNISHGETMCIFGACACARPFFSPFHARLEHIGPQQYYIILLSTQ